MIVFNVDQNQTKKLYNNGYFYTRDEYFKRFMNS